MESNRLLEVYPKNTRQILFHLIKCLKVDASLKKGKPKEILGRKIKGLMG